MKRVLRLAVFALVLASCNRDRNNNPIANAGEAAKDRDLQGKTFEGACIPRPLDALATGVGSGGEAKLASSQVTYRFEGANATRTTRWFTTLDCSGDAGLTFEELGDIKIDNNKRANDQAKSIDIHFNKVKVKISTQPGAVAANGINMCGRKDWNQGKEEDVTQQSADKMCANSKVPRTVMNVYRVDDKTLMLGQDATTDLPNRPGSLSSTVKFTAR